MTRDAMGILKERTGYGFGLCAGIDPNVDPEDPKGQRTDFLKSVQGFGPGQAQRMLAENVIDRAGPHANSIKLQAAQMLYVSGGVERMRDVFQYQRAVYPELLGILDHKLGDIGVSNDAYVKYVFDMIGCDAVTLNGYFGYKSLKPFLDRVDKLCIILVRTSNPGAGELQDRLVKLTEAEARELNRLNPGTPGFAPMYQVLARNIRETWNYNKNVAIVVGATVPEELAIVRAIVGDDIPILIPGFGSQGGEISVAVPLGMNSTGGGMMCNLSRALNFALDIAHVARTTDQEIRAAVRTARKAQSSGH